MTVGDDNDTLRMKVQPSPQVRATQSHLGKGVSSSSIKKIQAPAKIANVGEQPFKVSHRSGKAINKTPDPNSSRKQYTSKLAEKYTGKGELKIDTTSNVKGRVMRHAKTPTKTPTKSVNRVSKQDRRMLKESNTSHNVSAS